jgi:glutamate synthase domain-containing protein 3
MTGGIVVVLGRTGRNFAAGMSGGIAFVLDEFEELRRQCNTAMVELEQVTEPSDRETLRRLIQQHARYTGSARAKRELGRWELSQRYFFAVVPREYRKALSARSDADAELAPTAAQRA